MSLAPPPPSSLLPSKTGGRGACHHKQSPSLGKKNRTACNVLLSHTLFTTLLVLHLFLLATCDAKEVFTNHFYVKIHPDKSHPDPGALAHKIAKRNGFHNLGPLLGAHDEYHFVHHGLPHARHKRSVPHSRKLKSDPQVGKIQYSLESGVYHMAECGSRKESWLTDRREQSEGGKWRRKYGVVWKLYLMVLIHNSNKISAYSICSVRT